MKTPLPLLKDDELFIGDNGRTLHGKCWGITARLTRRDLSGQALCHISKDDAAALFIKCENCKQEAKP